MISRSVSAARRVGRAIGGDARAQALCAVTGIWAAVVAIRLAGDFVVPWDSKNQFYAFFRFLADSLHAGTSPLWNPYHYGGHPAVADPQSLIFTPGYLIWAALDPAPSMHVMDLIEWAHLLAGALGVVMWGSRRGWPATASIAAAIVFALGGAASARLNHVGIIVVYATFPLALLALEIALARRSYGWALAAGLIVASIVVGRNQVALLLVMLLGAWVVAEVVRSDSPLTYLRTRVGVLALMALVAGLLVAVPVLLTLEFARLSNRPEASLEAALLGSFYPGNLTSMFAANVFGVHGDIGDYWGPDGVRMPIVGSTDDSFNYLYFGAVPTLLVLWFGVGGRLCGRPGARLLSIALVVSLVFALGRFTPVFPFLYEHVPGIAFFRRPVDGLFVFGIALALLTGELMAAYARDGLPRVSFGWGGLAMIAVLSVLAETVSFSHVNGHGVDAAREIARGGAVALGVALLLWLGDRRNRRGMALAAVAGIAVCELVAWNAVSRLNGEGRAYYQVLEKADAEDGEAIAILARELARRHAEGARPRVEIVGLGGAWQNLAVIRKFEATNGYNPLRIGAYDRLVAPGEMTWDVDQREFPGSFYSYDCALARALGLEYVVIDRPIEKVPALRNLMRATALKSGPGIWIYRLAPAAPRVAFTAHVRVADTDAVGQFGDLDNPPTDGSVTVDDETPPAHLRPLDGGLRARRRSTGGTARIVSWQPGRIEIDVSADEAGLVVLHDTHYPGWIAEVDGRPSRILRADALFRAVEVPAGAHRVVFRFAPLAFDRLLLATRRLLGR